MKTLFERYLTEDGAIQPDLFNLASRATQDWRDIPSAYKERVEVTNWMEDAEKGGVYTLRTEDGWLIDLIIMLYFNPEEDLINVWMTFFDENADPESNEDEKNARVNEVYEPVFNYSSPEELNAQITDFFKKVSHNIELPDDLYDEIRDYITQRAKMHTL